MTAPASPAGASTEQRPASYEELVGAINRGNALVDTMTRKLGEAHANLAALETDLEQTNKVASQFKTQLDAALERAADLEVKVLAAQLLEDKYRDAQQAITALEGKLDKCLLAAQAARSKSRA